MKKSNAIYLLLAAFITVFTMACTSNDDDNNEDIITPTENPMMPITDWSASESYIKASQNEDFILSSSDDNTYIYEYNGEENVTISYMFGKDKTLATSCVTMENIGDASKKLTELLKGFKKLGKKGEAALYSNTANSTVAMLAEGQGGDGKQYISLSFAPYTPSNDDSEDDNLDYVDLGLSVKWAKCNVGATDPEDAGYFFAWSETMTKSEYWRENYDFCNNYANKYVFKYTNPLSDISGTKYDAALTFMKADWRMPTRDEALELIYNCNWEREEVNGINGAKVTGPNGKSIFIPNTGYKKQNKAASGMTHLWTSEAPSKSSEDAYTISTSASQNTNPDLGLVWKAWGLPVRAVKPE